ncbi:MAG TPA: adenine phosphoribosyltransferase [Vicinamibacterales bacterium]|nr:adenine phosphoribosyltransferase [Vicinamibacterales bacterium]
MLTIDLKQMIRSVPDFPKPGINFFDITTLLKEPAGLKATIDALSAPYADSRIDAVVGIESRGFILGSAVAQQLGAGFIPVRKPGKLPAKAIKEVYELEYGKDAIEIHADAIEKGQRVLIVDDVLATGGTAAATTRLVKQLGGKLHGLAFLIELTFLNGKSKLNGEDVFSVLQY